MIKVHGHSDDCIEIEGDVRDEVYLSEEKAILVFSDGTVASIRYDGDWLIHVIEHVSPISKFGVGDSDANGYTEELRVHGAMWVKAIGCGELLK